MWLYISNFQTVHTASLSNTDAASPRDVVQVLEPLTELPEPEAESSPALHPRDGAALTAVDGWDGCDVLSGVMCCLNTPQKPQKYCISLLVVLGTRYTFLISTSERVNS